MYLKRLDIQGFKSFPEKISLNFTKGITGVVGPNGSGKSNITDAVRWVLGEQSAKSLRGGKMEDVIFAGTQNRKPLGFAEVSLIIDNEDFKLPIDFSEITITRRVFRSGDSEYKINGASCRLKDIHELFMDTGIGKEGYSIIGQGRIEEILSSRGEDRRVLFEEATGIVKYRTRRDETLVKIQKERENLIRLEDIINELENNLEPLYNQSEKAKKYISLIKELKQIHINIFLIDAKRTEENLKKLKENLNNIAVQLDDQTNKNRFILKSINDLKLLLEEKINKSKFFEDELGEFRSRIEQKDNDVKLNLEKNNFTAKEIERLSDEKNNNNKKIESFNEEINQENKKLNDFKSKYNDNFNLLRKKEDDFKTLNEKIKEKENSFEKYNTDIIELYQKDSTLNANLKNLTTQKESYKNRENEINNINEENKNNVNKHRKLYEEISNEKNTIKDSIKKLESEKQSNLENNIVLTKSYDKVKKMNANILLDYNKTLSKYKIIKELEDDYEGYYLSVKTILKEKKINKKFVGIHGAVGEIISVPEKLETAIEIALGGYVQNIITTNEEDGRIAINYLLENKKGRATFLPLNVIMPKGFKNEEEILAKDGVIGIGSKLVKYDPIYENIISNILGRVVICDTIENGISLSKEYSNSFKIVTLQGELLNIGGSLTGGSFSKKTTNIFGRLRQLENLGKELLLLKENKDTGISKEKELTGKLEDNNLKLKINNESIIKYEEKIIYINQDLQLANAKISTLLEKEKEFNIEFKQLAEQITYVKDNIKFAKINIHDTKESIVSIKNQMEEFQNNALVHEKTKEDEVQTLTNIKVEISSLNETIKSSEDKILFIKKNISDATFSNELNYKKISEQRNILEANIKIINNERNIKEELVSKQKEMLSKLASITNETSEVKKELDVKEKMERSQLETISVLEKEKTKLEFKNEQIEEDRRQLFDTMWEEYEMTYQQALDYEVEEENINRLYEEEKKYKNQIKNLGNINPNSIEEYKETKERYDFLTSQRNDIIEAEEKLHELIMELTELMSAQFIEQFEIISENFNKVFIEVFNGGKAYLELSDKENILDSDIELIAQPPGKNLQNMNLLSGGERALTAIALLFGILKMKPSPFCILDEIEAALDESNVLRFSNYILNLKEEIQFILITHRKGTMEVADVLYGVTMEEQGISKLISVELESLDEEAM